MKKRPLLLAILDGFGIDSYKKLSNAVALAEMKHFEYLKNEYPYVEAHASGKWVGLPEGQMGNSEVGHLHIGGGRIIYQSLSLINNSIADKTFYKNKEIINCINYAKHNSGNFHIIGMLSDGGVHSHINHIIAALNIAKQHNLNNVYIHVITDGRDTKPKVAQKYINQLEIEIKKLKIGTIASISGRYYAMDRDKRWDRLEKAYNAIVLAKGKSITNIKKYILDQYKNGNTDEFIEPAFTIDLPNGGIVYGDGVLFANFRPDRAIQLASALTNPNYLWKPSKKIPNIYFVSMMKYADSVKSKKVAFKPLEMKNVLGKILSIQGMNQLRIAETEKIAHVTYFFDGGNDEKYLNSKRLLIPSPKVATYDLQPEMSAVKITNALIKEIKTQNYDLIILNFANPDMVGHTGDREATIKGLHTIDDCLKRIYNTLKSLNGRMILTADHGNAEVMIDEQGEPNKKHTANKVPIIITDKTIGLNPKDAAIANIAPTILELLNITIPEEMTQKSLITRSSKFKNSQNRKIK